MLQLSPLDAIINGYSFENALQTMSIFAEGKGTKDSITTAMFSTLDNFVKTVLFNERIYLTPTAGEDGNPSESFNAHPAVMAELKKRKDVISVLPTDALQGSETPSHADTEIVMHAIENFQNMHFVLNCEFPDGGRKILQELLLNDLASMELAISLGELNHFKGIFPGENLYLGFRQSVLPNSHQAKMVADVAPRKIRSLVQLEIQKMNKTVMEYGGTPLPELPPLFVVRVLEECRNGSEFCQKLFEIRGNLAMTRFRTWASRVTEKVLSGDAPKMREGVAALKRLEDLNFESNANPIGLGKLAIKFISAFAKPEPSSIADLAEGVVEFVPDMVKFIRGTYFSELVKIGGQSDAGKKVESILKKILGDSFNPNDMQAVSILLSLPDNLKDWKESHAVFKAQGGRLYPDYPSLLRPCVFNSPNPVDTAIANATLNNAVSYQLIAELLESGVPRDKIDEAMDKDNAKQELEKLRRK